MTLGGTTGQDLRETYRRQLLEKRVIEEDRKVRGKSGSEVGGKGEMDRGEMFRGRVFGKHEKFSLVKEKIWGESKLARFLDKKNFKKKFVGYLSGQVKDQNEFLRIQHLNNAMKARIEKLGDGQEVMLRQTMGMEDMEAAIREGAWKSLLDPNNERAAPVVDDDG